MVRPPATAATLSDEALLAGLAVADPDASGAFVLRFQGRVYGLALRIVGQPATAEDVAQRAFVRAWQHAGSFDVRRASVTTWLLTITRNLAIDEVRRSRSAPIAVDDLGEQPGRRSAYGDVLARQDTERLTRALDALPVEQRRAVLLATWHGRTAQEVCELEGVPLGTAKTRIRDGLRRLRVGAAVVARGGWDE
jgi:RNA polymerase sigma factor (sigma-70 family)